MPASLSAEDAVAFVAACVVVLFALALLTVAALSVHHLVSSTHRRQHRERMAVATDLIAPAAMEAVGLDEAVSASVARVGMRATAAVLREVRGRVQGPVLKELARLLVEIGETDRLGRLAGARRRWLRRVAARGLGECGGPRAVVYLLALLGDPDEDVRRTARNAVLGTGDESAIGLAVRSYLEDAPLAKGWRAAFYARVAAVAPRELLRLLERPILSEGEQKLALEALANARVAAAAPAAAARLDARNPELRVAAVRTLGKLGTVSQLSGVIERLGDTQWFVRAVAARALESFEPDERTGVALGRALHDSAWWVRANAARTLAHHGQAGIAPLLASLTGEDRYARDAALLALASPEGMLLLANPLFARQIPDTRDEVLSGLLERAAHA